MTPPSHPKGSLRAACNFQGLECASTDQGCAPLGSEEQLAAIYPSLVRWARARLTSSGMRCSAEDWVAQAVLAYLCCARRPHTPTPDALRAYLVRTMIHARTAFFRRREAVQDDELVKAHAAGPNPKGHAQVLSLGVLPFESAALVALHDLAGISFADLAWLFDLASPDAARMRRNRALGNLGRFALSEASGTEPG